MILKVLANDFVIYLCFHFLHLKIESQLMCLIHCLLATRLSNYASYLMTLLGPFKSISIKVFKMLKYYFLATQTIKYIYINGDKAKTFRTEATVICHLWQLTVATIFKKKKKLFHFLSSPLKKYLFLLLLKISLIVVFFSSILLHMSFSYCKVEFIQTCVDFILCQICL